ncbi:PEP-CTERM sorting domain-containing protein [Chroococcus sp. FPU101]|uniref:PEP-CTERM sorting domain-containing protein n=1 Tax=Chroococcus sp. FPU101 TaxID=1974212 RepID=UPI001A901772|nr:PEP-CTERM sorting domain-containing protein [Chroococcus sp. FPU101]GFE71322.1 hypothetical protein CFPU101_39320 [Chroococcus sp. FPU101]
MRKWQIIPTLLGMTVAGLAAQSANALTLSLVHSGVASDPHPEGFGAELKLFESEWRAGVQGPGDYEAALGPEGANYPLAGTFDIDWGNNQEVVWDLSYQDIDGIATLTLFDGTNAQTVTYDRGEGGLFKNFAFVAKVRDRQDGLVASGTSISIQVTDINGCGSSCDFSNTLTSAVFDTEDVSHAQFFSSDTSITSMVGKVVMRWTSQDPQPVGGGARSSVAVQLKAYDPGNVDPVSVPEPSVILGLLAIGAYSTLSRRLKSN